MLCWSGGRKDCSLDNLGMWMCWQVAVPNHDVQFTASSLTLLCSERKHHVCLLPTLRWCYDVGAFSFEHLVVARNKHQANVCTKRWTLLIAAWQRRE